jgi:predicted N-formylglutamate amidohydrolase
MTQLHDQVVEVINPAGRSSVVLVCEHASAFIPEEFDHLGLPEAARQSHVVWDPGALAVATRMSQRLDAQLVAGTVSRLVYDCNRPPDAHDAMPAKSEQIAVPGNTRLSQADRDARVATYYAPFRDMLSAQIAQTVSPVIVTIHSFTPVYHGQPRTVEIGVLHDSDARLADAMLDSAARHTSMNVGRNQPYGPADGVTYTLKEHGLSDGHLNVMLEIRNDLIATSAAQQSMADTLADWIADAFARTDQKGDVACTA